MADTILLIRHAETDWNRDHRWQGSADIPLNATGRAQARALAQRLASWPITTIVSSDLQRAVATAFYLGQALGLTPHIDARWRERGMGVFEGLTTTEISQRYPEIWERFNSEWVNPPHAEDYSVFLGRIGGAFAALAASHRADPRPDNMAAIVGHGGSLAAILRPILGVSDNQFDTFRLGGNTGLSTIRRLNGRFVVTCLNDTAHLERVDFGSA